MAERKRDKLKQLTASWAGRTWGAGKMAASLGKAAAKKVVVASTGADDDALGEALTENLDAMKGLAMKVGQMVSYLDGALPPDAQRVLERLQQSSQPMEWERIAPVIEEAFDATVEELYDSMQQEAMAAASIGQVHRAVYNGRDVAVKIQYPGIAATFNVDLGNLKRLGLLATLGTSLDRHTLVQELRDRLRDECNYEREGQAQTLFRELFADDPRIFIPEIFPERVRQTVLTSELAPGHKFYDFVQTASQEEKNQAGLLIWEFMFQSIFQHCALQADPHPGNYLFPDDGRVVFLDFGCVRFFDAEFIEIWKSIATTMRDDQPEDLPDAMVASGIVPNPDNYDWDAHLKAMDYMYEPMKAPTFKFTRDWAAQSLDIVGWGNPNKFKTAMPPEWLFVNRLQWGLFSVMALLEAEGDFGTPFWAAVATPALSTEHRLDTMFDAEAS